jgi:hypothetical protein
MTEPPQNFSQPNAHPEVDGENLLRSLRRKEGSWLEWGQACQTLQKAGYSPQVIFEETGFEPTHQNQVIVAAQVYASILGTKPAEAMEMHFGQRGSDILYELRILTQTERAAVAELVLEKKLDADQAREAVKAIKDFARISRMPDGFTEHPGDAIAYQAWKTAKQKSDLQERSRLIARGLQFAHSDTARKQVEQLLTDFSVTPTTAAPRLPVYRLESSEELPRVLPIVGRLPLSKADLQAVPIVEEVSPFNLVRFSGAGAWVPVPGWQVILTAHDPIVILAASDQLPTTLPGAIEEVLLVIDRAQRQWDSAQYFLVEQEQQLQIQWFESAPEQTLLGQLILIMRPKKVLDEDYTKELWQIDE